MSKPRVARHKAVFVTYQILNQRGELVEHTDLPVGYVHGVGGPLIEKVEAALDGASVGDEIEVTVAPEEGFGPHLPELTYTDDIANVPTEFRQVGTQVEMQNERGETRSFIVTRIENGKLTVDGNHPLAGQTLTFRVSVREVRDATPDEIANGLPEGGMPTGLH